MNITPSLFEAYLKCPTKCWLRSPSEPATGNTYADWVQSQTESYRADGIKRLLTTTSGGERALSPPAATLKPAKWRWRWTS